MTNNVQHLVREAYRQSERNLESDIALAVAADQRALGFCGWMLASAAVLTGLAEGGSSISLVVGAVFLVTSAAIAGYSARPVEMRAPGSKFSDLEQDISENKALEEVLKEMGLHNDEQSSENRTLMKKNGKLIWLAYILAIIGLAVPLAARVPELVRTICGC